MLKANAVSLYACTIIIQPLQNEPLLYLRNPHHESTFESTFLALPCSSVPSSFSRARFFDPASATASGTAPAGAVVASTAFPSCFAEVSLAFLDSSLTFIGVSPSSSALGLPLPSDPRFDVLTLGTPLPHC